MPVSTFRPGWARTPRARPRVMMTRALDGTVAPATADYYSAVRTIGMLLNDQWGCCTISADGHIAEQQTQYGQGSELLITDAQTLAGYTAMGFDISAGPPGNNPTDKGALIPDALGYLLKIGMGGFHIAGYGQVPVSETAKLKLAVAEFGNMSCGAMMPASAITQNQAGQPWTVVADDGGSEGGHCFLVVGYDATYWYAWTWGELQAMTYEWFAKYVEEAWPTVSPAWVSKATGKDPEGVSTTVLGAQFMEVTGSNPFHQGRHRRR